MLKYTKLHTDNKEFNITFNNSNIDYKNILVDEDEIKFNPIRNVERESYQPRLAHSIKFYFYKDGYGVDFANAGFKIPEDLNRNVFRKSSFVVEFYEKGETMTWVGSTTLTTYGSSEGGKGAAVVDNKPIPHYMLMNDVNDLFYIYNYRDFNQFLDGGRMFVKVIFQNALTGKRHYFVKSEQEPKQMLSNEFTEDDFYHEIRFFDDYTFLFYDNGEQRTDVRFKELLLFPNDVPTTLPNEEPFEPIEPPINWNPIPFPSDEINIPIIPKP